MLKNCAYNLSRKKTIKTGDTILNSLSKILDTTFNMSTNREAQEDELLALTSIYGEETVNIYKGSDKNGGCITVIPHLPQPLCIAYVNDDLGKHIYIFICVNHVAF